MFIILMGRFGQVILGILTVKLATTILSPSSYGQMSLLVAVIAGFSSIFINPVGMFVNRRLHIWVDTLRVKEHFLLYGVYLFVVSIVAALIILVLQNTIGLVSGMATFWIVLIVCISLFFNTMNQTFIPSLNLLNFRAWFVVLTLLTLSASLILSLAFAYFWHASAAYWQLGQVLGQALLGVFAGFVFFYFLKSLWKAPLRLERPSREMVVSLSLFATPLIFSVGLNWVQTQAYRFIVSKTLGLHVLGLFVAGYAISAAMIASFEAVLTSYFLPIFYRRVSLNDPALQAQAWQAYARAVFPALLLTVVFMVCFSHEFCRILLGEKFQSAYRYLIFGAFAEAGRVVVATYAYVAHARMKTYKLLSPNLVGAICSLLLVLILTPTLGMQGVGYALVLAYVAVTMAMYFVLRKILEIPIPWKALLKAGIFSLIFIGLFLVARHFFGTANNIMWVLVWLLVFGSLYLLFTYVILRPLLQENYNEVSCA